MEQQRERLGSRLGFILLSAGCAIGCGNVWKFPWMCGQYGGGAFVLIYIVFLILLGVPVMTMEFSLGRAAQMDQNAALAGAGGRIAQGREGLQNPGGCLLRKSGGTVDGQKLQGLIDGIVSIHTFHSNYSFLSDEIGFDKTTGDFLSGQTGGLGPEIIRHIVKDQHLANNLRHGEPVG